MARRMFPAGQEPEPVEEDDEDEGPDQTLALLAGLLLCMCCPGCEGTGTTQSDERCQCRIAGAELALTVLREEGLAQ